MDSCQVELLNTVRGDAGQSVKSGTSWVWSGDPSQEFARSVMCMDWQRGEKRCHRGEAGRNEQSYVTMCQHNGALKGH